MPVKTKGNKQSKESSTRSKRNADEETQEVDEEEAEDDEEDDEEEEEEGEGDDDDDENDERESKEATEVPASAGHGIKTRPRARSEEDTVQCMKGTLLVPTQLETRGDIATEKQALKTCAAANTKLLSSLHKEQKNLAYPQMFIKKCLTKHAANMAKEWGFTDADQNKWAADTTPQLVTLLQKLGRELRQPQVPKWVRNACGLDQPAEPLSREESFLVGFNVMNETAWRAPADNMEQKEFTQHFEVKLPEDGLPPSDLDAIVAVWPDGWKHEIAGKTAG